MQKITSAAQLKARIRELEITSELEREDLKAHFSHVKDSLRPYKLLQNAVKGFVSSSDTRGKVLNVLLGMAAGYITKKAVFGSTHNPLKKIAGVLLQMSVAGTVSSNGNDIQKLGSSLWKRLFKRRKEEFDGSLDDAYSHL